MSTALINRIWRRFRRRLRHAGRHNEIHPLWKLAIVVVMFAAVYVVIAYAMATVK